MADDVLRRTGREIGRVAATIGLGLLLLLVLVAIVVGVVALFIG